jgi:hypothetical protein
MRPVCWPWWWPEMSRCTHISLPFRCKHTSESSSILYQIVPELLTFYQPPKGLEKDVHALLRLLPDYNRILDDNRDVEAKDLDEADLAKVMRAVQASDHLYRRAHGSQV